MLARGCCGATDLAIPFLAEAEAAVIVSGTHKRPESWRLRARWRWCMKGLVLKLGMLRLGVVVGDNEIHEVGIGLVYNKRTTKCHFARKNQTFYALKVF